jgi:hypothetical protein
MTTDEIDQLPADQKQKILTIVILSIQHSYLQLLILLILEGSIT